MGAGTSTTSLFHKATPVDGHDSVVYNSGRNISPYKTIKLKDKVGLPVDDFFDNYELLPDRLGQGAFSEVRLARELNSMQLVAVKVVRKKNLSEQDIIDHRRECEILRSLDHPNIVKLHEYYEDNRFFYIVMEYAGAGELVHKLEELEDFCEVESRDIMLTLVSALHYCKQRGIAHRDIKPQNILLRESFKSDNEAEGDISVTRFRQAKVRYEIVLADFGFATQVSRDNLDDTFKVLQTQCGSPLFVAPEILKEESYNYKCDIWSLGVLCFMMLSGGTRPFPGSNREEVFKKIMDGDWKFLPKKQWSHVSKYGKEFVKKCLVSNDTKRATYEELLKLEWFKKESHSSRNKINMSQFKKFNIDRAAMKDKKDKQVAKQFASIVEGLEEEYKDNVAEEVNLGKYLQVTEISAFYRNPGLVTAAERKHKKKRRKKRKTPKHKLEEMPMPAPTNIDEVRPREALNTVYFRDVDELV